MTTHKVRLRVRREPVEATITRLETYVRRMESRYECSSAFALEATRYGHMKETAEVARWLSAYRELTYLREAIAAGRVAK